MIHDHYYSVEVWTKTEENPSEYSFSWFHQKKRGIYSNDIFEGFDEYGYAIACRERKKFELYKLCEVERTFTLQSTALEN